MNLYAKCGACQGVSGLGCGRCRGAGYVELSFTHEQVIESIAERDALRAEAFDLRSRLAAILEGSTR